MGPLLTTEHCLTAIAYLNVALDHIYLTNLEQLCDAVISIWTKISKECLQQLKKMNAVKDEGNFTGI